MKFSEKYKELTEAKSTRKFEVDHADLKKKMYEVQQAAIKIATTQTEQDKITWIKKNFNTAVNSYDKGNEEAVDKAIEAIDEMENMIKNRKSMAKYYK